MTLKKGSHRIAFVLPLFGIVIKFPIIRTRNCFHTILYHLKQPNRKIRFIREWGYSVYGQGSIKYMLFVGIVDNWREFIFFAKTRHPFCEPTYFSFFGLLNIQRKAKECPFDAPVFRKKCIDVMGRDIQRGGHHFGGTENFSFRNGTLMTFDYGDPKIQSIVRIWGEKLIDAFRNLDEPPS